MTQDDYQHDGRYVFVLVIVIELLWQFTMAWRTLRDELLNSLFWRVVEKAQILLRRVRR